METVISILVGGLIIAALMFVGTLCIGFVFVGVRIIDRVASNLLDS